MPRPELINAADLPPQLDDPVMETLRLRERVADLEAEIAGLQDTEFRLTAALEAEKRKNIVIVEGGMTEDDVIPYPKWAKAFFDMLRDTGNDRMALTAANSLITPADPTVTRAVLDRTYRGNTRFREDYEEARKDAIDYLLVEARRKATTGRDGQMLRFLLERLDRERFGIVTRQEFTGAGGGPIQQEVNKVDFRSELERLLREVTTEGGAPEVHKLPKPGSG